MSEKAPYPPEGSPACLRVGLVGAGMISAHHLIAWSRVPGADIVAVADPDITRAEARARAFGIARTYPSLGAMLEAEALHALDVASPRETHADLVREAAAKGIPVLCQKPLAPGLAEAEELVRDVAGRIRLMVHENWRFRPYYRQIHAWMSGGRVGSVSSCSISVKSSALLPDAEGCYPALQRQPFFRGEKRLLVSEALIHHIDVARWLLGPLRLLAARMRRTSAVVVGETAAALLFETARESVPVFIEGNLTCPGFPGASRDHVQIIGERASILMAEDRLRLLGPDRETIEYDHPSAYQESFDAAVAHFVACLRTGAPFETDPTDNMETLRLVEAAYASAGGVT